MIPFPEIEKIAEPPVPAVEQAAAWWWWAAAGLLAVMVFALSVWLLVLVMRRAMVPRVPARPEKLALRELKKLRRQGAALPDAAFGAALSGIVRSYLHRRMGLLARFATTDEILGRSRRMTEVPPPPMAAVFAPVLDGCDALKFDTGGTAVRESLLAAAAAAVRTVKASLRSGNLLPPQSDAPPA